MRRRVTFSRNVTLSLSRTCRCYCKYCAFATHRPHLYEPEEVERKLDDAARRGVKELLVLTGEKPEVNAGVAQRLRDLGHDDFTSYVAWACERALERGMLPHTNIGAASREELARLREVTASQGLMLESINPDLVVHQGSPTKHPRVRLDVLRATTGRRWRRSRTRRRRASSRRPAARRRLRFRRGPRQSISRT
jgi:FO synthase